MQKMSEIPVFLELPQKPFLFDFSTNLLLNILFVPGGNVRPSREALYPSRPVADVVPTLLRNGVGFIFQIHDYIEGFLQGWALNPDTFSGYCLKYV